MNIAKHDPSNLYKAYSIAMGRPLIAWDKLDPHRQRDFQLMASALHGIEHPESIHMQRIKEAERNGLSSRS